MQILFRADQLNMALYPSVFKTALPRTVLTVRGTYREALASLSLYTHDVNVGAVRTNWDVAVAVSNNVMMWSWTLSHLSCPGINIPNIHSFALL